MYADVFYFVESKWIKKNIQLKNDKLDFVKKTLIDFNISLLDFNDLYKFIIVPGLITYIDFENDVIELNDTDEQGYSDNYYICLTDVIKKMKGV